MTIYKKCPFYLYEIELNESYLNEMSQKGYSLKSYNWGYFEFDENKEKTDKYKILILRNPPTTEQIHSYKISGLNFIFNYNNYYFFNYKDAKILKQIQNNSLERSWVKYKIRKKFINFGLCLFAIFVIFILLGIIKKDFLYFYKSPFITCGILMITLLPAFIKNCFGYYRINKVKIINHEIYTVNWRKWKNIYLLIDIVTIFGGLAIYIPLVYVALSH